VPTSLARAHGVAFVERYYRETIAAILLPKTTSAIDVRMMEISENWTCFRKLESFSYDPGGAPCPNSTDALRGNSGMRRFGWPHCYKAALHETEANPL
jgi:hypothetical protein